MMSAESVLGNEIRDLAEKLAAEGWDRLRGLRLIHVVTRFQESCGRLNWPEAAGRATALIDTLGHFIKESPRADQLAVALRSSLRLADLIEAGRWADRIDRDFLPARPEDWTFVLAGEAREGDADLSETLVSLGFAVTRATAADDVAAIRNAGSSVLLASMNWLETHVPASMPLAAESLPVSHPVVALTDSGDFRTQLAARRAGARLLLDSPFDIGYLLGELAGLAWVPRTPFRVLLVDDDLAVLELSASILRAAGIEVLALTDPVAARDLMEEFGPEACVLDIEMPVCRGTDLAAVLRRNKRFSRLPVIYLSAFADIEHQLDARLAGADDYLVKPVDTRLLLTAVITRVRQFRLMESAYRQRRQAWMQVGNYRRALDAHASVSVTDATGAIIDVNQKFCETSGYAREELLGHSHRIVKSGHHPPAFYEEMWRIISAGRIWQGEVQSRRKDGAPYWAWSTIVPMPDEHGATEQYVAIRTDITEQKHVLDELKLSGRLLDLLRQALERFVATGDLREPGEQLLHGMLILTRSAYGFIGEVLQEEGSTPYIRTHAITDISWSAETRRLYDEGKMRGMEFRNLDTLFGAVLKSGETVIANSPSSDPRAGGVPAGHPPLNAFLGIPIYHGDRLVGIVGLANRPDGYDESIVDFLRPFTATYAAIIESSRLLQFRNHVVDELQRARDAAEKANRDKSEFLAGWGHELRTPLNALLGHAQLLLMNDQLDAEVREQAQEIVQGGQHFARMVGELIERVGTTSRPVVSEPTFPVAAAGSARRRILVAEDNPANQAVLRMQLEALGFEADIAADGVVAIEKWQAGGHDLILADRNMPGMDGLELTRAIRAKERDNGAYVPIIAITAVQHPEDLAQCRQAGMDDALPKPIEIDDLRRMLGRWLPRASLLAAKPSETVTADTPECESNTALDINYLIRVVGRVETSQARELVDLFTMTANSDLPACHRQLVERNGRTLAMTMHKLKSSARMVGALRFAGLAESLEVAAKAGRLEAAATLLAELENALQDVERAAGELVVPPAPTVTGGPQTPYAQGALPSRVLVVDDDLVVRRQMTLLLSSLGVEEVVAVDGVDAALADIAKDGDGGTLLITDLNMPGKDGIEFLRRLAEIGHRGCLILASGVDDQLLQTAADLARTKGMSLCGTLKKPVTAEALLQLLIGRCEPRDAQVAPRERIALLPADIQEGIQRDEFEVHFQPKVDAATLQVVGVEALARWRRNGMPVPPDIFIDIAERHGLIAELSQLLLTKALVGGSRLTEAGFPLFVAVNLSANWLTDIRLPEFVFASLQATGFPADKLILEITETGVMADIGTALDVLTRLRLKGFKLSIDDFGVGYSSMEQLQRLPFNELKLDRGFVHGAAEKPAARAILASSIEMAAKLNLSTVAEGVETQADLDLVRGLGCNLVQGWFVAKAMPMDDLLAWLHQRSAS